MGTIIIDSYNEADKGIRDGFEGTTSVSIVNCVGIAVITILTIIITFNKNNKVRGKWLYLIIIYFLLLNTIIGVHSYSGGGIGRHISNI